MSVTVFYLGGRFFRDTVYYYYYYTDSGIEQFTHYCTRLRTFICKGATQVRSIAFRANMYTVSRKKWPPKYV